MKYEQIDRQLFIENRKKLSSLLGKDVVAIFNANDVNDLKDLIEEDIYWEKGIWINYDIYPWIQAF